MYPQNTVLLSNLRETFGEPKTLLTLPSLWTHRTRPQGTWKLQNSFHSANSDHLFSRLEEPEEERKISRNPDSQQIGCLFQSGRAAGRNLLRQSGNILN
jgi:hypothetical protein